MPTQRRVKRVIEGSKNPKVKVTGAGTRSKSARNPPGASGTGPAKNPQRTRRLAGGLRASLNRSQTRGAR